MPVEITSRRNSEKPETFDFLGFTHICGKRRKDGKFTVRRQTIAKRQRAKLNEIRQWLKRNVPQPNQRAGREAEISHPGFHELLWSTRKSESIEAAFALRFVKAGYVH